MSDKLIGRLFLDATVEIETLRAERDRLREALEHMLAVYDKGPLQHQPHALFLARAALAQETGKSPADKWEEEIQ